MTKIITIKDKVNYTLNLLKDNNGKPEEYLKSIKDIIYCFDEKEKYIAFMGVFDFLLSNKLYQPLKLIIKELYNEYESLIFNLINEHLQKSIQKEDNETMLFLLNHPCYNYVSSYKPNKNMGASPLSYAAKLGLLDIVKLLIEEYNFVPNEDYNRPIISANLRYYSDQVVSYLFSFQEVKETLPFDHKILYPEIKKIAETFLLNEKISKF